MTTYLSSNPKLRTRPKAFIPEPNTIGTDCIDLYKFDIFILNQECPFYAPFL